MGKNYNIIDLVVANTQVDKHIYTFLKDGELATEQLDYAGLLTKSCAIAALLQANARRGERALLLYPPGLDFIPAFFGSIFAGILAVPAYPPDPLRISRTLPRLQAIAEDAEASLVLTTSPILSLAEHFTGSVSSAAEKGLDPFSMAPKLKQMKWLATDKLDLRSAIDWKRPQVNPDSIAFLQYTSGSTSTPKGVMVTHANLITNAEYYRYGWGHDSSSVTVTWMPNFHDLGLMDAVVQPAFYGFHSVVMPPTALLKNPLRWLYAISNYRATFSSAPNFAFELCTRKATEQDISKLDLSSWQAALNAAEPVRKETMEKFYQMFRRCGFRWETFSPGYGLAEATLKVSATNRADSPVFCCVDIEALEQNRVVETTSNTGSRDYTSCGRPMAEFGTHVLIVDPETLEPCPPDRVGEIWVSGPGVAHGYWNKPEETERTFKAKTSTGEGPFLRTGDLGFLRNGELYVTGRLKDLIIIDGRNHYPQDIELSAEKAHPAIRPGCSAAFALELPDQSGAYREHLAIVAEVDLQRAGSAPRDLEAIRKAIQLTIAEQHDLDVLRIDFIKPGTIPKTSSGKIQRRACRQALLEGTLEFIEPTHLRQEPVLDTSSTEAPETKASNEQFNSVLDWLIAKIAERKQIPRHEVAINATFAAYGMKSSDVVGLVGELEQFIGRNVEPSLFYAYPTIESLSKYLAESHIKEPGSSVSLTQNRFANNLDSPVAIIGIGCRFPENTNTAADFWKFLAEGRNAIRSVPSGRWDTLPQKPYLARAGFLEDVYSFDPAVFGISPVEAARMDPQQRLLLETSWEALEDAGLAPSRLCGQQVGVFIGISTDDYARSQFEAFDVPDAYVATGSALSMAANRISYLLGLQGPSVSIDTACSSSLTALHYACQSLRTGECRLALVGGVNLILSPALSIHLDRAGFLSPDAQCKTFDAAANGYVRGEGAATVVLKMLDQALLDNDDIYAVIRATAINQDGRSNGLTAPNPQAQQQVILEACSRARIDPNELDYLEAHGTGTALGDPIEAASAAKIYCGERRATDRPLRIGSVKASIGHLEAAAGIAGLIKVALMLKAKKYTPSLNFELPNPQIDFEALKLKVQTKCENWPERGKLRLAAVSSFGFGGTNTHAILEEAPSKTYRHTCKADEALFNLLPISASSPAALKALTAKYLELLDGLSDEQIAEVCAAAAHKRDHLKYRLVATGRSKSELCDGLQAFLADKPHPALETAKTLRSPTQVAFVYTGQGTQWWAMGCQLYHKSSVFRKTVDRLAAIIKAQTGWAIIEDFLAAEVSARDKDTAMQRFHSTEVAQPLLFLLQAGLTNLLKYYGVLPAVALGHSSGEIAAAWAAGWLDDEAACLIVQKRGQIMQRQSGKGKTAAIEVSLQEAESYLQGLDLSIAAVNSPRALTISGDAQAVTEAVERCKAAGKFARMLKVDHAFHSSQMDVLQEELRELGKISSQSRGNASTKLISTVTGRAAESSDYTGEYWWKNCRFRVEFASAITEAAKTANIFVEIGPHPVLLGYIQDTLGTEHALGTLKRNSDEAEAISKSLARLAVYGLSIAWDKIYPSVPNIKLPFYPWQRETYRVRFTPDCVICAGQIKRTYKRNNPQPVSKASEINQAADKLYEIRWQKVPWPQQKTRKTVYIISDDTQLAQSLAEKLKAMGCDAQITNRLPQQPQIELVWLPQRHRPDDVETVAEDLTTKLLEIARFQGRLTIVTFGAVSCLGEPPDPLQALLWGLGRSLVIERQAPTFMVDLGWNTTSAVELLAKHLVYSDREDVVAIRETNRYVARLVRLSIAQHSDTLTTHARASAITSDGIFRPDRACLITGGFGGLGLLTAEWLISQGVRHLILAGRVKLPARSSWRLVDPSSEQGRRIAAIRRLEQLGASVLSPALDVSDEAAMIKFLQEYDAEMRPPIGIVFHIAGEVKYAQLEQLDRQLLREVFPAKISGSSILDRVFDKEVRLYLYSSLSSVIAEPGSGAYSAANAFLNALAERRRAQGKHALSICWGPWESVGMVERSQRKEVYFARGLRSFRAAEGLSVLDAVIERTGSIIAASIDWPRFTHIYPRLPLLEQLEVAQEPVNLEIPASDNCVHHLKQFLSDTVTELLGAKVDDKTNLASCGVDSLLAITLKNRIRSTLMVDVHVGKILSASIVELAENLAQLLELAASKASTDKLTKHEAQELLSRLDELSDEQVEALLAKLAEGGI
ncbi:MAG: beta-ketoacyl synthase N-terminal-like domain-containing protein [Acidobacteriota bacterium]|nr:AMP-binding protein [Blastocatellia bacterium]MDW8412843.1 beta-ketoacyl synthase N-terminal-like domain-containing protein [Acidobacteriota bacterium]